jgi:hypothetical protein
MSTSEVRLAGLTTAMAPAARAGAHRAADRVESATRTAGRKARRVEIAARRDGNMVDCSRQASARVQRNGGPPCTIGSAGRPQQFDES